MSEAPAAGAVNRWLVALAVMSATIMEVLDTTVVNVSLPHIAGSLSVGINEATWCLTSYLVANAVVLPMTGWLSSVFGRKRLLLISVTGFTAGSFACGAAPTLSALIVFRLIQGMFGGVLQPMSQAVLLETFPLHERGKGMAFWGIGMMVAPILGPVFGGWVTDSYSWRWLFYVNLPVGMLAIFMTQRFLHDPPHLIDRARKVDGLGIGLLVIGVATLQFLLDKGQDEDWFNSRFIIGLALVAGLALIGLVVHELTTEDPVIDLRVLKDRTYAAGLFLITTLGFVLFGSMMILPVFLQTLLGYPSMQAGIALSPRGIGAALMMPITGVLTSRVDPRILIGLGMILAAVPLIRLGTLNLDAGYWDIFWPQLFQGAGMSLLFVPLSTVTMAAMTSKQIGHATSLYSLMRNLGAGVGIAVMGTMLAQYREANTAQLASHVTAYDQASRTATAAMQGGLVAAGSDPGTASTQTVAMLSGMVQQQGSMIAFASMFRFAGVIFLVLMPLILVMRRPRMHRPAPAVH